MKRDTFLGRLSAEVERVATDANHITLYGRRTDKFGDNGLVSVIIGWRDGQSLHRDRSRGGGGYHMCFETPRLDDTLSQFNTPRTGESSVRGATNSITA